MSGPDTNSPARPTWREPTRQLRLIWGNYTDRYLWGLILIIGGTVAMQGGNIYAVTFLGQGIVALTVGWAILPARGWRRVLSASLAPLFAVALLAGPQAVWTLAAPFLLWLCVRHRPWRSTVTVLFPTASGVILAHFFEDYDGMPLALAISLAVLVASAWLARYIATRTPVPPAKNPRIPSKTR